MTSKTIVFPAPLQVEMHEREVADPGPGEVLIQTLVSLVSTGTESWCFRGVFEENTSWANWVKYPFQPGYSNLGRLLAVGEGGGGYQVGDRVCTSLPHAQYGVVEARDITAKVPDPLSDEEASWGTLSYVTQTGVRRAQHRLGDCAVVIGLGPLGQQVVQFLRVIGCEEVLAIDTVPLRLELAAAHGATETFLGSAAEAQDFVLDHTAGRLADVVYDVTGHWAVLPLALPLARQFGKVVLIGDSPEPTRQHLTQDVLARQVDVLGTHNAKLPPHDAEWTQSRQVALFYTYLVRGQMSMADLITHHFWPEQATEVYPMLQENRSATLGVIFDWRQDRHPAGP